MFFNKKKSEIDTPSLKNVSKSSPVDSKIGEQNQEQKDTKKTNIETPLEPIREKQDVAASQNKKTEKGVSESKDLTMKRRDTDNEFDIGTLNSKKESEQKDDHTLVNKVDSKLEEDKTTEENKKDDQKVHLHSRHSERGGRGNRRAVYANKFAAVEQHLGINNVSRSTAQSKEAEGPKPTLIGDRPETEKYEEKASHQNLRFSQTSGNNRGR